MLCVCADGISAGVEKNALRLDYLKLVRDALASDIGVVVRSVTTQEFLGHPFRRSSGPLI